MPYQAPYRALLGAKAAHDLRPDEARAAGDEDLAGLL
jgi:hypothetical protein